MSRTSRPPCRNGRMRACLAILRMSCALRWTCRSRLCSFPTSSPSLSKRLLLLTERGSTHAAQGLVGHLLRFYLSLHLLGLSRSDPAQV
eukprot:1132421-Pleurochrysis_carterae.AAC.2